MRERRLEPCIDLHLIILLVKTRLDAGASKENPPAQLPPPNQQYCEQIPPIPAHHHHLGLLFRM